MLRPARGLERLANPRRRLCAADRPARLRQSLPQPGSPPTKVCYDYSAQPSIAEAGLAPASMSKTEGCTQEQVLGPAQDRLVIVDGKTLRHAQVELVSAVNGQGRWLGTVPVKAGSNEIPAAR